MEPGVGSRRIFAYGTLAFAPVMEALLGRRLPAQSAVLPGYARYQVRGERYPGIVAEAGTATPGVLWEGLDAAAVALLDRFEGSLYERRAVRVRAGAAAELAAEAYVVAEARAGALSREPWDERDFAARHLPAWVQHCAALRSALAQQAKRAGAGRG
jgi:gamma-glutamylcyclotransferase (GGCT)/AIG2-like uncharacterized protein YtfP